MKVFPKVVRVLLMSTHFFRVTSDSLTVAHVSPTKRLPDVAVPSALRQESGCGSLVQATYRSLKTSVDVDSQWIVRGRVLGDVSKLPADLEMCPAARWK